MQEPKLLLADEPTSSLDPKTSVEIMELMARRRARRAASRCSSTCTTSSSRSASPTASSAWPAGAIVFDGPPADLTDDVLKTIYGGEDWLQ